MVKVIFFLSIALSKEIAMSKSFGLPTMPRFYSKKTSITGHLLNNREKRTQKVPRVQGYIVMNMVKIIRIRW